MNRLFYGFVFPLTVMGSLATLVLLLLQALFRRGSLYFSGLTACCLAFFFYAVPIASLGSLLAEGWKAPSLRVGSAAAVQAGTELSQQIAASTIRLAVLSPAAKLFLFLPWLWLAGFLLSLCAWAFQGRALKTQLKRHRVPLDDSAAGQLLKELCAQQGLSCRIPLFCSPKLCSPFVCGLLRPEIYLPDHLKAEQSLFFALSHEVLHLKNHHLPLKGLCELLVLIHWFNPLAYLLKRQLDEACEIQCDLQLTREMDGPGRREYAQALLMLAQAAPSRQGSYLSASGKMLSARLLALRQRLPTRLQALLSLTLAALLLLPCLPAAACVEQAVRHTADNAYLLKKALTHVEDFLPQTQAGPGGIQQPAELIRLQWVIPEYRYCSRIQETGLCIVAEEGAEVLAAADGIVLATTDSTSLIDEAYGNTVILLHSADPGISTCYTHCQELLVQPGDVIRAGSPIGTLGRSGAVSGPMCRFQVSINGHPYNPLQWFSQNDRIKGRS